MLGIGPGSAYKTYTGHFLEARSLEQLLGFGISFLVGCVCGRTFVFEELIVRAYTMSEVMDLGGCPLLAIVISVSFEMSCQVYQGLLSSIMIAATFLVLSDYFGKTRRMAR